MIMPDQIRGKVSGMPSDSKLIKPISPQSGGIKFIQSRDDLIFDNIFVPF